MKKQHRASFHGAFDSQFNGYLNRDFVKGDRPEIKIGSLVFTQDRKLTYSLFPHFHPYANDLTKRLLETSLSGLQAADTEYLTQIVLSEDGGFNRSDGSTISLRQGDRLMLKDGARIILDDDKVVRLAGFRIVEEPTESTVTLERNAPIRLRADSPALLPDGTPVTRNINTKAVLPYGRPHAVLYKEIFTQGRFDPEALVAKDKTHGVFLEEPLPVKELDFSTSGAYSVYNWELFYHAPLSIAIHLSRNQRYDEAQRWFHYIFNPTDDSEQATPERFWKVKPFQGTDIKSTEEILVNLSTEENKTLLADTLECINRWQGSPFRPHIVARFRQSAYQIKTVMAYLDNLIAWGDTLFRQDSGETINEATQLYVLAANILGPRPQMVPRKGTVRPQTYEKLRRDIDAFGNALCELETDVAYDILASPGAASDNNGSSALRGFRRALYFCVPPNDKLMNYWTIVADRLFKIRNSLNILGIFRQLPLFEPPIDPALLARAVAAGLDIGAVISGLNQPLPLVRFQFLVQKALEICQEVKSLGGSVLSSLEKEDNEALAVLRAKHEGVILGLAEYVKYSQWQETIKAREGIERSLSTTIQKYIYYERLLGNDEKDIKIPDLESLDTKELEKLRKGFRTSEPEVPVRKIDIDIAKGAAATVADALGGSRLLSSHETRELAFLELGQIFTDTAAILNTISAAGHAVPDITVNVEPWGCGVSTKYGGDNVGSMIGKFASAAQGIAGRLNFEGSRAARMGSYARREQEWAFQSNMAAAEITQIYRQLRAAEIREAVAKREWENHQKQMRHSKEIEQFLSGESTPIGETKHKKTSTLAFYTWMKREIKALYAQCFQFTFDVAKKAERALQHEIGDPQLSFLQYGYLAGKEGLLAGEKLYFDIKRMEMAYHDLNQREYELTKHISLLQLDPNALLTLRSTGSCEFRLPEELFDLDGPGHYFRRIKTVALSLPCITGPYTGVNCSLKLTKSTIRKSSLLSDPTEYARKQDEDVRFDDYYGNIQSIVTSTGQNDSGLFETNLRDERVLPFEGSGVIESEWQLQLPANPSEGEPCTFDYNSITDVVLHLRYTAREGGALLRKAALLNLGERLKEASAAGCLRLFSIRHDFPSEWARFTSPEKGKDNDEVLLALEFELRKEHYPYWANGRKGKVMESHLFARTEEKDLLVSNRAELDQDYADSFAKDPSYGKLKVAKLVKVKVLATEGTEGKVTLYLNSNKISDLWLVLKVAWEL